ncbi:MAG: hypothetical protein QM723_04990 [Myxococcaceae bacterium]
MSAKAREDFLARLYVDAEVLARFTADARAEAKRHGLDEADAELLAAIDRTGLELAAHSFAHKRSFKEQRPPKASRIARALARLFTL